jgi:hypothetical protein
VGQPRVDLDRHPAVETVGRLVDGGHDVTGVAHVVGGHRENGVIDVRARGGELVQLVVVGGPLRHRQLEDRRVRRDADDVADLHQLGEVAGVEPVAGQVVEPDGDSGVGEGLEVVVRHECSAP